MGDVGVKRPGEITVGAQTLRIVRQGAGFAGIIVGRAAEPVTGATDSEVEAKLRKMVAQDHPDFIGMDGARARFLRVFRQGFSDTDYIGDGKSGERHYKAEASRWLNEALPLADACDRSEAAALALRAINKTNMIAAMTKPRLADVLRGPKGNRYVAIAADFANGDLRSASEAFVREFKADGVASWPCLTYLPFLWAPDRHMFLKPTFTRAFAERIGHSFQHDYVSEPNPDTYRSLLDMTAMLRIDLADLAPADNIDLHSFMWVVMDGYYVEKDAAPDEA